MSLWSDSGSAVLAAAVVVIFRCYWDLSLSPSLRINRGMLYNIFVGGRTKAVLKNVMLDVVV